MKKICFILALATLGACSSEENLPLNDASIIRLTSEISSMSRGTDLNQQSTQIVRGQKVGITITGAKSAHNNVAWTVGNNGELINTGEVLYWGDGEATITAYHPYNESWNGTDTDQTFSVSTDQRSKGYLDSDLLWFTTTAAPTTAPIALNFTHKLAKINVTLTSEDITNLSNATINICNTRIATYFNPATGIVTTSKEFAPRTIKAGVTTSNAYTASAIIIPQTVASGTNLIHIEHNGINYYYSLPADRTFESGNAYNYTLKMKRSTDLQQLLCVSENIKDWYSNENITGDANEKFDESKMVTITMETAGTLKDALGEQMLAIEELKIVGPLNGDDVKVLRQMAACNEFTEILRGSLTVLDLSEATIVEGGGIYYEHSVHTYTTVNNEIGEYMFYNSKLQKILLPDNITAIGRLAFRGCHSLTNMTIPNSVTTIGRSAFNGCRSLTNVTIPNSVTTIGEYAFQRCN